MGEPGRNLLPFMLVLLSCGCSGSGFVVPETLEGRVDRSLTFLQLIANPDSYRGSLVVVGGEVLQTTRTGDATVLEVLQLPLDDGQLPVQDRLSSQGRFRARHEGILDPALLENRARITVVGEVTGSKTDRLDETDYRYPTLDVKHLHLWAPADYVDGPRPGPWWGVFGGVGFGGGARSGGGISIGTGF